MQVTINNQVITFTIQYTKAKKFSIDLSPEGLITVKAPLQTTEQLLMEYIKMNASYLLAYQERIDNRQFISRKKSYVENENFLYLGKAYPLTALLESEVFSEEEAMIELKKFYTKKTREIVKKSVKRYEKLIGVKSKSITIVESARTWGTCNSNKELTFNYRLSMAPEPVIDYVVVHELCHLLHLNHDRSFWRKVGAYDSNFKEHEEYLAKFGGFMTI